MAGNMRIGYVAARREQVGNAVAAVQSHAVAARRPVLLPTDVASRLVRHLRDSEYLLSVLRAQDEAEAARITAELGQFAPTVAVGLLGRVGACELVQPVRVLRHDGPHPALAAEFGDGPVRLRRLGGPGGRVGAPPPGGLPDVLVVQVPRQGRDELGVRVAGPESLRAAEVGDSGGGGEPGPAQDQDPGGFCERGDGHGGQPNLTPIRGFRSVVLA